MKTIIQIIGIVLLGYIAATFLPWYSIAFVALVMGYAIPTKANFVSGFLGGATLWGVKLLKITSVATSELAEKVALIFPVKEVWILIAVTLVIGGLVTGMATLTGALLRPPKRKTYFR